MTCVPAYQISRTGKKDAPCANIAPMPKVIAILGVAVRIYATRYTRTTFRTLTAIALTFSCVLFATLLQTTPAQAGGLKLSAPITHALEQAYAGHTAESIREFQQIEASDPDSPVAYLGEAEARWWQIYCEACELKWNMIDAWRRPSRDEDQAYLRLTDKTIQLADEHIARGDSAEMELWAGMGYLLRARLLGLRDERHATAQAGVQGRARMLRCLQLDRRAGPLQLLCRHTLRHRQSAALSDGNSRRQTARRNPSVGNRHAGRHVRKNRGAFLSG
jgi:hypothetical protein